MKAIQISLLLLCVINLSYAQKSNFNQIKGIILSENDSLPVENATIELFKNGKVKYVIANKDGFFTQLHFEIPDSLRISSVGYKFYLQSSFPAPIDGVLNMHNIYLKKDNIELATIQAIGQRKLIDFNLNIITYNVDKDPDNDGLNGLDVIQKAPLIDIIGNKSIKISGDKTPVILLNGRKIAVLNTDPIAYLRSLPASYLSKIEINSDPPAKYRIDGYEYLINLITSKKLIDGIFGSINAEVNTFGGIDQGTLLMLKKRKTSLSLNFYPSYIRGREGEIYQSNKNIIQNYEFIQSGKRLNESLSATGNAELTIEIDSLRLLSFNVISNSSKITSNNSLQNSYFKSGSPNRFVNRNGFYDDNNGFNTVTVDYEMLKNRKRDILTLSGMLFQNHFINKTNYTDKNLSDFKYVNWIAEAVSKSNQFSVQFDLSKYISNSSGFESGIKESIRLYNSESSLNNSYLTSDFKQTISNFYSSYTFRKETNYFRTGVQFDYAKDLYRLENSNEKKATKYFIVMPYFTLIKNLSKNRTVSLKYNYKVTRPGISYLTSAIKYSDIENLQTGNIELKPERIHNIDWTYSTSLFKKPLVCGLYFINSPNLIVQTIKPYRDSLLLRTYTNNSEYMKIGNTIYYSKTLFEKLTFRINSDIYFIKIKNNESDIRNEGFSYKIFVTLTYKLPWKIRFSSQNYIYGKNIELQGYADNFSDLRLYLARNFFNERLNIGITIYQPYNKKVMLTSRFSDFQFSNFSYFKFPSRYVGFSMSYDFGDFSKVMKRDKNKTIKNDDIKQ